jgi:methylmalonyl-CoA/ethylmalonyl-CoA epimerase
MVFHHIGIASADIEQDLRSFTPFNYKLVSEIVDDPGLGIRCCLLEGGGPRLELVSDLANCEVVTPWLNRGTKYYHLAFEVDDIEAKCAAMRASGGKVMRKPKPARLFGGRPVAFVMLRSLALVEYIQR